MFKKCDCDYKLHIQELRHKDQMEQLHQEFIRLKRDMAWFQYTITGNMEYVNKCEFELKVGGL